MKIHPNKYKYCVQCVIGVKHRHVVSETLSKMISLFSFSNKRDKKCENKIETNLIFTATESVCSTGEEEKLWAGKDKTVFSV